MLSLNESRTDFDYVSTSSITITGHSSVSALYIENSFIQENTGATASLTMLVISLSFVFDAESHKR